MKARLVIPVLLAALGCGVPANTVDGNVQGAPLHPLSVVSFQTGDSPFGLLFEAYPSYGNFTERVVAVFDVGGGCDVLDETRPPSKPAALFLEFGDDGGPGPGHYAADAGHQSLNAFFWRADAGVCEFTRAVSASGELDSTDGDVTGTFEVGFGGGNSLRGTFDAIPCGFPPGMSSLTPGMPPCL